MGTLGVSKHGLETSRDFDQAHDITKQSYFWAIADKIARHPRLAEFLLLNCLSLAGFLRFGCSLVCWFEADQGLGNALATIDYRAS